LRRHLDQIEVAVAIDIDPGGGATVMVVVEPEDIAALDEPAKVAVGVVEEAIALVSAEIRSGRS
jgi:hypothetical protein